jgi:hypothetical protein
VAVLGVGAKVACYTKGMKLVILYRPQSEHATAVQTFLRDFKYQHEASKIELVDADTREGIATASLYDLMTLPAVLALRDDGSALQVWQGEMLPLMDEVASYVVSQG